MLTIVRSLALPFTTLTGVGALTTVPSGELPNAIVVGVTVTALLIPVPVIGAV
jgi:hypothetical protein